MKLTVIGGGGVRTPLFVASALKRAGRICLDELCLMDIDSARLETIACLCRQLGIMLGSPVRITATCDARQALDGASHVVTTIRVGNESGRVLDERIALRREVLGQETTGPGGFAMAMRSIPAILEYAGLAARLCPQAWIFNFTNPAGLVTQALHRQGHTHSVGICDGANLAQHDAAQWLGVSPDCLRAEVFGLNHLSWTQRLWWEGADILPSLLENPLFCAQSSLRLFDHELVRMLGLYLNEYLYYYYYAERALSKIQGERRTRGEEVHELNQNLLASLKQIDIERSPAQALNLYFSYEKRRSLTYMNFANPAGSAGEQAGELDFASADISADDGEGYAGVALDLIMALERREPYHTALNVPNAGAIPGFDSQDIVEVSCSVDEGAITPLPVQAVPPLAASLMFQVKTYERLAVEAILSRSCKLATLALMAHPLVLSYTKASRLLEDYLQVHASYVGEWS